MDYETNVAPAIHCVPNALPNALRHHSKIAISTEEYQKWMNHPITRSLLNIFDMVQTATNLNKNMPEIHFKVEMPTDEEIAVIDFSLIPESLM